MSKMWRNQMTAWQVFFPELIFLTTVSFRRRSQSQPVCDRFFSGHDDMQEFFVCVSFTNWNKTKAKNNLKLFSLKSPFFNDRTGLEIDQTFQIMFHWPQGQGHTAMATVKELPLIPLRLSLSLSLSFWHPRAPG